MNRHLDDIERELRALFAALGPALTDADRSFVTDLLNAGEVGVAVETLCTQLYEYDAPVSSEQADRLAAVGEAMSLNPRLWELLQS